MRYETWSYDIRLEDLCRKAEARRKWYWRLNWGPVFGGLLVMAFFGLFVWGCVDAYIYVTNWIQ